MFNLLDVKTNNKMNIILLNRNTLVGCFKYNFLFFSIAIVGRIFRWIKYEYYMKFILPTPNKPHLFLINDFIIKYNENGEFFLIFADLTHKNFDIIKTLLLIKKPSIFNKRGFRVFNRVIIKKKGKVTSYITNK